MAYKFIATDGTEIGEDICRCLSNILNIPCGSIPLSRDLGISWSNLSKIPSELENDIATEIIEKIETYEPRVAVEDVSFEYDGEGSTIIQIRLEKGGE